MLEQFEDGLGLKLVKYIIQKDFSFANKNYTEHEELVGYGMLGVTLALKQYDGKHNFVNFASGKIKQSIISYLRTSYSKPIYPYLPERFIYNENDIDAKDSIQYLFKFLNSKERSILTKLYLDEKPYQAVIKETGLSKFRIFSTRRRAFTKLRSIELC
jgi:RNA polymerase sigma factor (sigma-70 family)